MCQILSGSLRARVTRRDRFPCSLLDRKFLYDSDHGNLEQGYQQSAGSLDTTFDCQHADASFSRGDFSEKILQASLCFGARIQSHYILPV